MIAIQNTNIINKSTKKMKLQFLLIISLLLHSTICWWDLGHMLVAQIAEDRLKQTGNIQSYNTMNNLVIALNEFTDQRSNTFAQAAVWADDLKSYKASFFDNYHFTNIVYDPDFLFKGMTQLQQDINAVNIINWCKSVLAANNDITFQKAFMARYLLHLVGDIHQPLHSTMMFNKSYLNGDMGGNLIHILTPDYKDINLHSYFDSIALEQDPDNRISRPLNDTFRASMQAKAKDIINKHTYDSLKKKAENNDPHTWGVQSFQIAVDKIYSFFKIEKQATEAYQTEMRVILEEQLALGGYRLANTIVELFGSK